MAERIYCSEHSLDEPLSGTADQVDVWVLLEYHPAWKARALEDNGLRPAVREWLQSNLEALAARGLKARPQLMRRPEVDSHEVQLLIGLPDALVGFSGQGYGFLDEVRLTDVVADPAAYSPLVEPRYFVCTNGQRDLCCARFGLPVYAALREQVGDRAWQITHLGGHRFAPNVLALPQGALYGRVAETDVAALVRGIEGGELAFSHLRGRTWLPAAAQVAEAASGRSDLRLRALEEDEAGALVHFDGADGVTSMRVRRASEPLQVLKSCGDTRTAAVWPLLAE